MSPLLVAALALGAAPGDWQFHDEAAHAGRSLLAFRTVELRDRPVVPVTVPDIPPGARFGLLPVGNVAAEYAAVVWAAGETPRVWVAGGWHALGSEPLAVPLTIGVRGGDDVRHVKRTVLLRRSGDGLAYAVRGYAAGRLRLGDRDYAALLTDGNGDGCFDAAGADRVWIDLDGDGTFDGLTEQFLLGPPLARPASGYPAGRKYLLKPDPLGTAVEVRERPADQGTLRLTLPARLVGVSRFKAQLVSDWGELVTVTAADRPLAVPVGRYQVEELTLALAGEWGKTWTYRFAGSRRCAVAVVAGRESPLAVLDGVALAMTADLTGEGVGPGQEIAVTPAVRTPAGLDLIDCHVADRADDDGTMAEADIRLSGPGGVADRTSSSFL